MRSISRLLPLLLPMLALAACNGEQANVTEPPVANIAAPTGQTWVDVVAKTPEGGYRQGNPDAPIKLVEYGSRSCPTCGRFAIEGVEPLRSRYIASGKVSYEFREFFVHPQDLALALLGRCVPTEAFFPVLDQMFAYQGPLNAPAEQVYPQIGDRQGLAAASAWADGLGMVEFMKQRALPEARARQCLADQAALDDLAKQIEVGSAKGVSGTPTFFINDRKADVAAWSQLEPLLQAAGAR